MRNDHHLMLAANAIKNSLNDINSNDNVGVGCSGGADSLALLAGLSKVYRGKRAPQVHVIIIDHQLQDVTAKVAQDAAHIAADYGFIPHIIPITIEATGEGMESDARRERYAAFKNAISTYNLKRFLIGHTKNDQAEQVILGLIRGSGTRSLSGIRETRDSFVRPFLNSLTRIQTEHVCREAGLNYWVDPHNSSTEYKRVCVRQFLNEAREATGHDLVEPLSRTAQMIDVDAEALDYYANIEYDNVSRSGWHVESLSKMPKGVRLRVLRRRVIEQGCPADKATHEKMMRVEALISDWKGQGKISFANGVQVGRDTQTKTIIFE